MNHLMYGKVHKRIGYSEQQASDMVSNAWDESFTEGIDIEHRVFEWWEVPEGEEQGDNDGGYGGSWGRGKRARKNYSDDAAWPKSQGGWPRVQPHQPNEPPPDADETVKRADVEQIVTDAVTEAVAKAIPPMPPVIPPPPPAAPAGIHLIPQGHQLVPMPMAASSAAAFAEEKEKIVNCLSKSLSLFKKVGKVAEHMANEFNASSQELQGILRRVDPQAASTAAAFTSM